MQNTRFHGGSVLCNGESSCFVSTLSHVKDFNIWWLEGLKIIPLTNTIHIFYVFPLWIELYNFTVSKFPLLWPLQTDHLYWYANCAYWSCNMLLLFQCNHSFEQGAVMYSGTVVTCADDSTSCSSIDTSNLVGGDTDGCCGEHCPSGAPLSNNW